MNTYQLRQSIDKLDELLNASRSRYTGKTINLPCFDGVDPINWILRAEEYFGFHETYDEQRVRLVAFNMSGEGAEWYRWMRSMRMLQHWADFKEKVMIRFGISSFKDYSKGEISLEEILDSNHENDSMLPSAVVVQVSMISNPLIEEEEPTEESMQEQELEVLNPQMELLNEDPKCIMFVEHKFDHCYLEQDDLTFGPIWRSTIVARQCDSNFAMKTLPTHHSKEHKDVAKGIRLYLVRGRILSSRRMVFKFYTFKEIYWDVYLLHLEDKVVLKRLGMIRIWIYIILVLFIVFPLISLVN